MFWVIKNEIKGSFLPFYESWRLQTKSFQHSAHMSVFFPNFHSNQYSIVENQDYVWLFLDRYVRGYKKPFFLVVWTRLYSSPVWKIQKMVKNPCLSVKNMRTIWCEKYQKKFGLNWRFPWGAIAKTYSLASAQRFALCMSFARQFADLKNFTWYV